MNKNNRKKKGLSKRVLALMLCCFCLMATIPISAFALETGETQITEESISEQQSESASGSLMSLSSETSESQTEADTQQSTSDEIIEPIIESETATEVEIEAASETGTEADTESEVQTDAADSETEAVSEAEVDTGIGAAASTETEAETDAAGSEPETGSEAEINTETESEADSETESETDATTETEPSYLEQLNAYYNQAVEVGPDADDAVYAEIYNGAVAVYAAAGSPSAENDPDVYNAVGMIVMTLQGYGYDPYAVAELPRDENSTSGTSDHIEIEISGTVNVKIGDEEFNNIAVTLTTSDSYTVTAYTLSSDGTKTAYTNFTFSGATDGDGSTDDETVELSGSYPTGTKSNQVYYVISVVKTVSVTLADGTKMDIPVAMTVTTSYWDEENNCPGIRDTTTWQNGYYIGGSGIDVPISGEYVGQAITKGKLAIKKTVTGEDGSSAAFQFYLQNSSGEYLVFSNNAYTGTSATLTDACKVTVTAGQSLVLTDIPVGTYTITEIQKDGYIITDAEGNESDNYTKDYIVETKSDDEIPIANFTNKKLSDEAGIKIKKAGYGLSSYPNPTVAIYNASDCTSGVPDEGATAVWTGTLTTNSGEFIYLNVTLPTGDYVVVETGAAVEGYDLTTTLTSANTTISGMSFTAVANTVHELVVTNTYAEQPKVCNLTISKTVGGNMGDQSKEFAFTATLSGEGYTFDGVTYSINNREAQSAGTGTECRFNLKHGDSITFIDLPIGATFTVTETTYSGYVTTVDGVAGNSKEITLVETNSSIAFVNTKDVTIDTGILLDTLPYILILGVVAVGAVLLIKKRRNRDDD